MGGWIADRDVVEVNLSAIAGPARILKSERRRRSGGDQTWGGLPGKRRQRETTKAAEEIGYGLAGEGTDMG